MNFLSVFDHFVGLALKGVYVWTVTYALDLGQTLLERSVIKSFNSTLYFFAKEKGLQNIVGSTPGCYERKLNSDFYPFEILPQM